MRRGKPKAIRHREQGWMPGGGWRGPLVWADLLAATAWVLVLASSGSNGPLPALPAVLWATLAMRNRLPSRQGYWRSAFLILLTFLLEAFPRHALADQTAACAFYFLAASLFLSLREGRP